jgi:hypothetical protein
MHDTESDTFVYQSWPEKFSGMLKEIGIDSESKEKKLELMKLKMMITIVDILLKHLEW